MVIDHKDQLQLSQPRRHPKFWFDDGSLFLSVGNDLFKVHRTLLYRHSRVLPTWPGSYDLADYGIDNAGMDGCAIVSVPEETKTSAEDVEALLEHLYHDSPLSLGSSFSRVVSVLRASSPGQLDFPALHKLSRDLIEKMISGEPGPFCQPDHFEQLLALSAEYRIASVQKSLYYSLITTCDFDMDDIESSAHSPVRSRDDQASKSTQENVEASELSVQHCHKGHMISRLVIQRCTRLMKRIMDHFAPILFTAAATPHMDCTDVLADKWMTLVIQPALESGGVYKPIETLQRMAEIDWAKEGLCGACVKEKKAEWTSEQELVWGKMDEWLESEECDRDSLGMGASPVNTAGL